MFIPLLLSALLLCNSVLGVPQSAEPTAANPSPVRPVAEITPAPTMPPVVELLRRGGSNPAIVPRDDSDLMKRLACGAYYVTCDSGTCCYLGQECYRNSAGGDSCRYPTVVDYSSLLASLTSIYGGYGGRSDGFGGIYSSILSSYMDLLTNLPGTGFPTSGRNQPVNTGTAGAGSSSSNSGSGSSYSSSDTTSTSGQKKKSNTGMIVGIAVGSVVGVAIVGAIVWYCCRKKRNPTPPLPQYPQPQPAYAAQAAQIDIKPPQAYQFQHQLPPAEVGGAGIVPQQQVPPGNAVYAVQGTGYQGATSPPPPPQPSALEMSGDTQFLPPQQHQQQSQYGPPIDGAQGPLVEMDAGERR